MKNVERWFLALCAWPAILSSGVALEALHFHAVLGRWPVPSRDDPKSFSFLFAHSVLQLMGLAEYAVILVVAFLVIRQWRLFLHSRPYQAALLLLAGGVVLGLCLPSTWWEWFWD